MPSMTVSTLQSLNHLAARNLAGGGSATYELALPPSRVDKQPYRNQRRNAFAVCELQYFLARALGVQHPSPMMLWPSHKLGLLAHITRQRQAPAGSDDHIGAVGCRLHARRVDIINKREPQA
jgi:hypothetical protein